MTTTRLVNIDIDDLERALAAAFGLDVATRRVCRGAGRQHGAHLLAPPPSPAPGKAGAQTLRV
jgi:hypothetical protein